MADQQLFDEKTRRKLEQLMLAASRVRAGAIKGERRSVKRGTSIEFADYRNYAPGDDLRRLDWNIYARLGRPLTRLYEDEEDLAVHLLFDSSASMNWGTGEANKFDFTRRLVAGLGYISLTTNDRLTISALGGDTFGPARGRAYSVALLSYMVKVKAAGRVDINAALKAYALKSGRPGLTMVISDLFSPEGYIDGINALLAKGHEVALIHTLAPEEIEPPLAGDLRLVDVETGAPQEVSIDGGMRDLYMQRVQAWRDDIRQECGRRGVHFVAADTGSPWEKVILYDLRRAGVVK